MLTKSQILEALKQWINQRPGLDFGNYGEWKSYRSELRSITRDRADALQLMQAVSWRDSITADDLIQAFPRAFSGRLEIKEDENPPADWDQEECGCCSGYHPKGYTGDCRDDSKRWPSSATVRAKLTYTTGQYWPTEYRKAAAAVLARVLWDSASADMPKPNGTITRQYGRDDPATGEFDSIGGLTPGEWLRRHFRREFGRGIQSRWFN